MRYFNWKVIRYKNSDYVSFFRTKAQVKEKQNDEKKYFFYPTHRSFFSKHTYVK